MRHASNAQTRHDGAHARYGPIKQTQIIILYNLVIMKGFGVQATTIEGQNHCALRTKFRVSDSQNTRNHFTSDRRSKRL